MRLTFFPSLQVYALAAALGVIADMRPAQTRGGGGHGGRGGAGHHHRSHPSGGGSSLLGRGYGSYYLPPVLNPDDLLTARLHRYVDHLLGPPTRW